MDDPRLAAQQAGQKAFLEVPCGLKDAVTAAINAALDAAGSLRQPVPADAVPDAALDAMCAVLNGCGQWLTIHEAKAALAAALPHLAPRPAVAKPTPDAWIEGTTVDMLREVLFPGFSHPHQFWEDRIQGVARRIDDRIAAGPVAARAPVWTAEKEALKFLMDRACPSGDGWTYAKQKEFDRIYEAAFRVPGAPA